MLQQQLSDKDAAPRRAGLCTAHGELQETTLHETLQSLQFLRDSASEQLQWEFGSWKISSFAALGTTCPQIVFAASASCSCDYLLLSLPSRRHRTESELSIMRPQLSCFLCRSTLTPAVHRDQLQELRKMLQHAETERDLQHFGCKSLDGFLPGMLHNVVLSQKPSALTGPSALLNTKLHFRLARVP